MWAAGIAAVLGVVARWRVVGPGFVWLTGGVVILIGLPAAVVTGAVAGWVAVGASLVAVASARRWALVVAAAAVAAGGYLLVAVGEGNTVVAVSGAIFLGAVTAEMMLGHWYLVDPRLPRWALRRLAWAGCGGAVLDFAVLAIAGVFPWTAGDAPVAIGFMVLATASAVLMLAVLGALREEGYSGVMAATGLSYLALLTAIGASVVGRLLASGPVLS